jgi:hypothetical protein
MKEIIKFKIIILCLIFYSCQNNNDDELEVFSVERFNYTNPAPIPVMNGTISFIPGKNTPEDATYRMYFDISQNPTTLFNLKTTEKKYTNLKINTTYYWRVETISREGKVLASSPIWKFVTGITITVRTQKDLELLGSNKYSKIEGILVIGDIIKISGTPPSSTDISDLSPLKDLIQVYKLVINNNNLLKNLDGLSNIKIINSDLIIGQGQDLKGGNSSLEDISALSKIESLGGLLIIYNNDNLTNLTGLESLKSISSHLAIENNMKLDNFCALKLLFDNKGLSGDYFVTDNGFNPTENELIDGTCKN